MQPRRPALCSLLVLIILANVIHAGVNRWTSSGPYRALVGSFLFHPANDKIVFVGGPDGLYRSLNGGQTWQQTGRYNFSDDEAEGIPICYYPDNPQHLIAAPSAILQSTDGGDTWTALAADPTHHGDSFYDLQFYPGRPKILYAVGHSGVYKSLDGGRTWQPRSRGIILQNRPAAAPSYYYFSIPRLKVNPANGNIVYVLLEENRLYKTTNGGNTWHPSWRGMNTGSLVAGHSLAMDPLNPAILYVGSSDGVYRTSNAGTTWEHTALHSDVLSISIDPNNPQVVFAAGDRLERSTNGGISWQRREVPGFSDQFMAVAVHPNGRQVFLAGQGQGVFRSDDAGITWSYRPIRVSLDPQSTSRVAAHIERRGEILTLGLDVYQSKNNGGSWDFFIKGAIPLLSVLDVQIHPRNPKRIFISGYEGLATSGDEGQTWKINGPPSRLFALDPQNEDTLFLSPYPAGGVERSTDQGQTWKSANAGLSSTKVTVISVHPMSNSVLWVGTDLAGRIFLSTNAGKSWQERSSGLYGDVVRAIATDPVNPNVAFAALEKYPPPVQEPGRKSRSPQSVAPVFKTVDGGRNWAPKGIGMPLYSVINMLKVDPAHPRTVYAGGYGLYVSVDGGETWREFDRGGFGAYNIQVLDFLINPSNKNQYFIATNHGTFSYTIE